MTLNQLTVLILSDQPWQQRYPEIAAAAQKVIEAMHGVEISTTALVEYLMPLASCRGEQITARNQLFKILMTLAKHNMSEWCERGPPKKGRFGTMRPILWRKPAPKCCPHCGKEIEP